MSVEDIALKIIGAMVSYHAILIDRESANLVYIGLGKHSVQPSEAGWAIIRITEDAGAFQVHWANNGKSDLIWNNRATYF